MIIFNIRGEFCKFMPLVSEVNAKKNIINFYNFSKRLKKIH